ncbi:MAG: type IV pilus secretin PilQ [Salinisphaeraceae bacterium]
MKQRLNRPAGRWTALLVGLTLTGIFSAQAGAAELESVEHARLAGNQVLVTLTLSGPAPEASAFTVDQPARLSLDLPGTKLAAKPRYRRVDAGNLQAIALAEGGDRTRVVLELSRIVPYQLSREGNRVLVRLGQGTSETTATTDGPTPTAAPTSGQRITDIDFRRTEAGGGRVTVELSGTPGPVDVNNEGQRIVATMSGVQLPANLEKRLDVIDFATPVKYIDTLAGNGATRVVVTPIEGADFEQVAYQSDDTFVIELQPVSPEEKQTREPEYTGERISLSFQSVDVRAVLQILADVADVNMVVSESVSGAMALELDNVPWDQALDIILASEGLGMRRQGNVILVAPLPEIATREQAELEAQQATSDSAPLVSEIIQINYARAADFAALLKSGEVSLLSSRGQVTVDERTNTLLINETRAKLEEIRRVINRLDIPVRQVLIESRIVVANREFARNLGVTASATDNAAFESPSGGNYTADTGFAVNLPVAGPAGTLTTSIIGNTFNLDLALSALESENRGEVISSPRVITANAKEAKIEQGVEIPYLEAASSGAATVQFKEAVLSLTVTPQITPDERVIMDLFVTQDTQGDAINVQGGGQVPSINTRSLTTQVLVENGETVVLGGIYEQEDRDVVNKVPGFGDIPLLGAFFRNTSKQRDKRELLLFVTPKILKEGLQIN